jgi:hypothetical protein
MMNDEHKLTGKYYPESDYERYEGKIPPGHSSEVETIALPVSKPTYWHWMHVLTDGSNEVIDSGLVTSRVEETNDTLWDGGSVKTIVQELFTQAVPDGWKLVPIEPTIGMMKAASKNQWHNYNPLLIYSAFINASPPTE